MSQRVNGANRRRTRRSGFTLVEIILVIAILGVLAAIATPSLIGFFGTGRQINRESIARTIYLAAQSRLSEKRIYKTLNTFTTASKAVSLKSKFAEGEAGYYDLGVTIIETGELADNYDSYNLVYIRKPKGALPTTADGASDEEIASAQAVYDLLDPVILDKSILDDAIVIEYNNVTGMVLSVFYSDSITDGEQLDYLGTSADPHNISGRRPYEDYHTRNQGYYGVGETGEIPREYTYTIDIWDGYMTVSGADGSTISKAINGIKNVLYAEMWIPVDEANSNEISLKFAGKYISNDDGSIYRAKVSYLLKDFSATVPFVESTTPERMSSDDGSPPSADDPLYYHVYWVLDYVGDNMVAEHDNYSIGRRGFTLSASTNYDVTVTDKATGISRTSSTKCNPYFYTENSGLYKDATNNLNKVYSARHLYNVRYAAPNTRINQIANIDLNELNNVVSNFKPIDSFNGTYDGHNFTISNLIVGTDQTPASGNAGLFAMITAGTVKNLKFEDVNIFGSIHAGVVAGLNHGEITNILIQNFNVNGRSSVGGIAGVNNLGGTLSDITVVSIKTTVPVNSRGIAGGIVGSNSGVVVNALYLAMAPSITTPTMPPVSTLYPITGEGTGTVTNCFYLMGAQHRIWDGTIPEYTTGTSTDNYWVDIGYNTITDISGGGEGKTTEELNLDDFTMGSNWDSNDGLWKPEESTNEYPYPTLINLPLINAWPEAKHDNAAVVVYYEKYSGFTTSADSYRFYYFDEDDNSYKGNLLNQAQLGTRTITEAGYGVIYSKSGIFDIWLGDESETNKSPSTGEQVNFFGEGLYLYAISQKGAELTSFKPNNDLKPLAVYFNTAPAIDSMYILPNFAKGVYNIDATPDFSSIGDATTDPDKYFAIRTPQQMLNITNVVNGTTDLTGKSFTQELDLDFSDTKIGGQSGFDTSVVDGEFKGIYTGRVIRNLNIDSSNSNIGLFSQNSGTISQIGLEKSTISGGDNTGGIVGTNNAGAVVEKSYVSYSTINTSSSNAGGIVGNNSGTVSDVYFLSDKVPTDKPISGGSNVGGIVGLNGSTIERALYIAPAPQSVNNIYPICGTTSGTADTTDCYYLAGDNYRINYRTDNGTAYNPSWTKGIYNKAATITVVGGGEAMDTAKLNTVFQGKPNWMLPSVVYPYPIIVGTAAPIAWPETSEMSDVVVYYEIYEDMSYGFFTTEFDNGLPTLRNARIIDTGYGVLSTKNLNNVSLSLGNGDSNQTTRTSGSLFGLSEFNLYKVSQQKADKSFSPRSDLVPQQVFFNRTLINAAYIIPNFAKGVYTNTDVPNTDVPNTFAIRTPQQLINITPVVDLTSGRTFNQELAIDFDNTAIGGGNRTTSVVNGTFAGRYNGLAINNLNINATTADIGLFSQLSGATINNVTLNNASITGRNNTGGIAGQSTTASTLTNCSVLTNSRITGSQFTGGIIGQTAASTKINGARVAAVSVIGGQNTGGITGLAANLVEITNCEVTWDVSVASNILITGGDYTGGIVGQLSSGATITGCHVDAASISGGSYIGGIVGDNAGSITSTFIGGQIRMNSVVGSSYLGGIAGICTGSIDIAYADNTSVGREASTNVGGIAGELSGAGSITNVFYNYGTMGNQPNNFVRAVQGDLTSTGGLVGNYNTTTDKLTNAYSDAFFDTQNNLVVGTDSARSANLTNVFYLKDVGYNSVVSTKGGSAKTVEEMRAQATATALGTVWAMGTGAQQLNPLNYTYPRLNALVEPQHWPLPNTSIYTLKYYEKYEDGTYGTWGGDNDDHLKYNQRVLEDGYCIEITGKNNSGKSDYTIRSINGVQIDTIDQKPDIQLTFLNRDGVTAGTVKYGILDLTVFERYAAGKAMVKSGNKEEEKLIVSKSGLEPIFIELIGPPGSTVYFRGYFNPLYAKAIFGTLPSTNPDYYKSYEYIIRTPRQMRNIAFDESTLTGKFRQEIDIDFQGLNTATGYHMNPTVHEQDTGKIDINFTNGIVYKSGLSNIFTGTYTARNRNVYGIESVKALKNISIPSTGSAQAGNIGIFSEIGAKGKVNDLILDTNDISGTTGNVGVLAGTNAGTVTNIQAINCTVTATTGKAGGIVGQNNGTLENVVFVSQAPTDAIPIKADTTAGVGGITGNNLSLGVIKNALYLAPAPGSAPISPTTGKSITEAYYLSGTFSTNDRPNIDALSSDYNILTGIGQPLMSHQLNGLSWGGLWIKSSSVRNSMTSAIYPYMYLDRAPTAWPVASIPADNVAYYEKYDLGNGTTSYGYYSPKTGSVGLTGLVNDKPILETGYVIIMPDNYAGAIKIRDEADGRTLPAVSVSLMDGKKVVNITNNLDLYNKQLCDITVNDVSTGLSVNTLFAKAVFDSTTNKFGEEFLIRTPMQMRNISSYASLVGLTFTQNLNLDFSTLNELQQDSLNADGAVVHGVFKGTFNGSKGSNKYEIVGLTIESDTNDNVGLFSQNAGVIQGVTLKGTSSKPITITGKDNVGGIVGHNLAKPAEPQIGTAGQIMNCEVSGVGVGSVSIKGSSNVGGIVGLNEAEPIVIEPAEPEPTEAEPTEPVLAIAEDNKLYPVSNCSVIGDIDGSISIVCNGVTLTDYSLLCGSSVEPFGGIVGYSKNGESDINDCFLNLDGTQTQASSKSITLLGVTASLVMLYLSPINKQRSSKGRGKNAKR